MSNENQTENTDAEKMTNEGAPANENTDAGNDTGKQESGAPAETTETGTNAGESGEAGTVGEQLSTSTDVDASVAAENQSAAASTVSESEKPTYDDLVEQAKAFLAACQSVGCDAVALLKETAGVA